MAEILADCVNRRLVQKCHVSSAGGPLEEQQQQQCLHLDLYPGNCPWNIMKGACYSCLIWTVEWLTVGYVLLFGSTASKLLLFPLLSEAVLAALTRCSWLLRLELQNWMSQGVKEGVNWACMPATRLKSAHPKSHPSQSGHNYQSSRPQRTETLHPSRFSLVISPDILHVGFLDSTALCCPAGINPFKALVLQRAPSHCEYR